MVISWNDMNAIILKEPRKNLQMFKYSNKKNTEFWNYKIEIQYQYPKKTYSPVLNSSFSKYNLFSIKIYKNNLHLFVSSAMTQYTFPSTSILSITGFKIFPYNLWSDAYLSFSSNLISKNQVILNISKIQSIPAALEYKISATALPSVPLWFGQSSCRFSINNTYNVSIQDFCSITCGLDESQKPTYSISGFADSDIKQMQIDKTNGIILSNLPNTWKGEEEYSI